MTSGVEEGLSRSKSERLTWQPQIVTAADLPTLAQNHSELKIVDYFEGLTEELFRIKNPSVEPSQADYSNQLTQFKTDFLNGRPRGEVGSWVYYPWHNCAVHVLNQPEHQQLRTARNRNLITADEQSVLQSSRVGVAGLSVGSSVVSALAMSNCYAELRIADGDEMALTNLNRIRGGLQHLGLSKAILAARGIYELDPWAQVKVWTEGLALESLTQFLSGLDVVVDEMDDLALKTRLRLAAKTAGLPVVMVTDDGDDSLLDVERFDLDPQLPIFHGKLSEAEINRILEGNLTKLQWLALSLRIIDPDYFPAKLSASLPEIGRTIAGVPQLGSSAMIAGALAAYAVRMILTKQDLRSGKTPLKIEEAMLSDYHDQVVSTKRSGMRQDIKKLFNNV